MQDVAKFIENVAINPENAKEINEYFNSRSE
jgi:hypothetical protein